MELAFDEAQLFSTLSSLEPRARAAFAAACATRQLSCYEAYSAKFNLASAQEMRNYLAKLWADIESSGSAQIDWRDALAAIMDLAPKEDDDSWTPLHAYADDAIASLAYSVRCLVNDDPQEAAWAARRAYESADQAAINALNPELDRPESETRIKSHAVVQLELRRQSRDLQLLAGDSVDSQLQRVKKLAYEESLLEDPGKLA